MTVSRHPEDAYRCVGSRTESIELASDFGPPNQPTIQPGNTRAVTRTIRQHAHRATSIMNSVSRARFSSTELTRKSDGRTDGWSSLIVPSPMLQRCLSNVRRRAMLLRYLWTASTAVISFRSAHSFHRFLQHRSTGRVSNAHRLLWD